MARRIMGATLLFAGISALAPGQARAVRLDYVLDFGIERNDNLLLTPTDPVSLTILRPGVGFSLAHDSSTWQAELSGRSEYLDYRDGRFDNTFDSALNGRLNWVLLPERLSFTVEDDLTLQPVNTFVADVPGNRQQVNVVSLGPTLLFNWTQTLQGAAELRYINSDAEVTEEFNSDRVTLALRATKELSATTWLSANVQSQRVEFDSEVVARDYDRTDLFARYLIRQASLDFAVDAGLSRIGYRDAAGGDRSEPLLRVEATWHPNDRHRLVARASSQFSDAATDALAGIGAESMIPGAVRTGETVVNASPYEERGLELQYTFASPRLTVVAAPYYNRLRYVGTDAFDQNTHGARLDANWQVRPRWTLGGHAGLGRISYVMLDRVDETREAGAHVEYEWTRKLSSRLSFSRYERDLSVPGQDAAQNVVMLTLSYRNR